MAEKKFEITSSDFKESTRDGVKLFHYDGEDKLQQAKIDHFGKDKIEEFEKIEKEYHEQMGNVITELATNHYNQEDADKELLASYRGAGIENEYYMRREDDELNVIHRTTSMASSLAERLAEDIWDAISHDDDEEDDD